MANFYVYIMTGKNGALFTGLTNDLRFQVRQHKNRPARKYNLDHLVYFEAFSDMHSAMARQSQIRRWARSQKQELVELGNPEWRDLSEDWG